MILTRHRLLAYLACLVALGVAGQVSAQTTPLAVLDYNAAKLLGTVEIAGGAIDITNGAMVVPTATFGFVPTASGPGTNEYAVNGVGVAEYGDAAIHDAIVEGSNFYNGGYWNGTNGIYSSTAATDPNSATTVGWIDNDSSVGYTTYRGVNVPAGDSIIGYTYIGDTDLSGQVDISDVLNLGNSYGTSGPGYLGLGHDEWYDGDTDYNGQVDISDALNLGNNYLQPALFSATPITPAGSSGITPVPEPASLVLAAAGALLALGLRLTRWSRP